MRIRHSRLSRPAIPVSNPMFITFSADRRCAFGIFTLHFNPPFSSNFINERIENADSNRSPLLSIENQRTESQLNQRTHSKTQELIDTKSVKIDSLSVPSSINENNHHDDEHTNSNKTVNKLQQSSYKSLPITTPEIKPHEKTRNDE